MMMSTFLQIFRQEIGFWLKKPTTYLYFIILLVLAIQDIYDPSGKAGASEEIYRNSPIVIFGLLQRYSLWLTFLVISITANTVNRDYELGVSKFYYALPISKTPFLLGRFLGALFVLILLSLAIGLGALISNGFLFHKELLTGSLQLLTYIKGYVIMVLPNLFVFSSLSFALVSLTRSIIPAYAIITLSFLGFLLSSTYIDTASVIPQIMDPFGTIYFYQTTHYWNIAEQNSLNIPISPLLIINRIIWLLIGVASLLFTISKFRFEYFNREKTKRKKLLDSPTIINPPVILTKFNYKSHNLQLLNLGWFEFKRFILSKYGFLLTLIGLAFLIILTNSFIPEDQLPTTFHLITKTNQVFKVFMYMLLTFFSAEVIWNRKSLKTSDLFDVLPVPNWVFVNAVVVALFLMSLFFIIMFFIVGIITQTFNGYHEYQLSIYAKQLIGVNLLDYILFGVLSVFIHILFRNKFLSIFIVILFWVGMALFQDTEFYFPLYHYKYSPNLPYSDINKYGHFWEGHVWFLLFWFLIAGVLLTIGSLLWNRGRKLSTLKNINKGTVKVLSGLGILIVLTGGYIYLNINVREDFPSKRKSNFIKANYEKRYKKYENSPQPEIIDIKIEADIFPSKQMIEVDGSYILKNNTSSNIDTLHITLDSEVDLLQVKFNKQVSSPILVDKASHRYMYAFQSPLAIGDSISFQFKLEKSRKGFGLNNHDLLGNGTFIDRGSLMPSIVNYSFLPELTDNELRKEFGLKSKKGVYPSIDSQKYLKQKKDSDITFEAIISTSENQTAVTKGHLVNKWKQKNRNYFHYKTSAPTSKEYALFSGEYKTNESMYRLDSITKVQIQIMHHSTHEKNINDMMTYVQKSLSYYHQNFGSYHSDNFRLIEVAGYRSGARSFPQTIAVYENGAFLHTIIEDEKNFPFFIIAHEAAHQWFGSQKLVRQPVKGANMVNETLAQYAALMVLKKNFGMQQVKKWLQFSMKRYLKGHVNNFDEVPLKDVEDENYIYYDKGALSMFALQEYMGEESVNDAILECIQDNSGYLTNTTHLLKYFKAHAPDSVRQRIIDLFEKVIIYDNSIKKASYKAIDKNNYELYLEIDANKFEKAKLKTEINFFEWITIEIETKNGNEIIKRQIKKGVNHFTIHLKKEPKRIFLDPNFNLLDKNPDDNEVNITEHTLE